MMPRFQNRALSFWQLQIGGWLLYTFANVVGSIPYWRNEPHYVAYRSTFLIVGFLVSFVMCAVCKALWQSKSSLFQTLFACALVSYGLGLVMSAAASSVEALVGGPNVDLGWSSVLAAGPGGSFVLVAWSALYFGVKHHTALEATHLELIEAEALARGAQLEALRYQLQPHFLFNTLNAISTLVISQQTDLASEMIEGLGDLLRTSLEMPELHTIALRKELANTRCYLAIEEIRFGPRLAVSFEIENGVEGVEVPRFLLQPLVENSIRHGISRSVHGGQLVLRAHADSGTLVIDVENDQHSSPPPQENPGYGLGLKNTRRRLQAMYGERGRLLIEDRPNRFAVSVRIPMVQANVSKASQEVES